MGGLLLHPTGEVKGLEEVQVNNCLPTSVNNRPKASFWRLRTAIWRDGIHLPKRSKSISANRLGEHGKEGFKRLMEGRAAPSQCFCPLEMVYTERMWSVHHLFWKKRKHCFEWKEAKWQEGIPSNLAFCSPWLSSFQKFLHDYLIHVKKTIFFSPNEDWLPETTNGRWWWNPSFSLVPESWQLPRETTGLCSP